MKQMSAEYLKHIWLEHVRKEKPYSKAIKEIWRESLRMKTKQNKTNNCEPWTCSFCLARNDAEAMTNCCASAETCPLIWEKPERNSNGEFVVTTEP